MNHRLFREHDSRDKLFPSGCVFHHIGLAYWWKGTTQQLGNSAQQPPTSDRRQALFVRFAQVTLKGASW